MHKIDARGKVCPLPLFYTKKQIDGLKTGEEFEVLTDDVTARNAIPQWIKEHGHEIVKIEESGIDLKVTIRKHFFFFYSATVFILYYISVLLP